MEKVLQAVAGGVAGLVIGWTGTAVTLVGDVSALKASMERVEKRLDQLVMQGARK